MAPSLFAETWRSLWHAVTSNDRHATYDSPYRTGQHIPLPQSRHTPLTSIATSAIESRTDLALPADSNLPRPSYGSRPVSMNGRAMSPASPYSPGMRSAQRRVESLDREGGGSRSGSLDKTPVAEIQMQNFSEGLPPPPPVSHSWKRIERWLGDNYAELLDNICTPATTNDVNELEHELDCTLPVDVRDSIQLHDGQERGGRPTGLLFGCMLLDCEEIVEEWNNWRAVNEQYLVNQPQSAGTPTIPIKAFAGPSSSSSIPIPVVQSPSKPQGLWQDELLGKQDSQPPNAVQKAYAHASWIPLARDWGGNCIAVDLAPGPMGKWGQIILFGRDYDTKFVVAQSWASFMATLADDLNSGSERVIIDEESGDLKLHLFQKQGVEPPYLEILRWRCDQKYGRRPVPRKRSSAPGSPGLRINSNLSGPHFDGASSSSPYASPTVSERGRSPNRPNGKSPIVNGPMRPLVSSPLARVAEEAPAVQPLIVRTDSDTLKRSSRGVEKLIPIDTPRLDSGLLTPIAGAGTLTSNKENVEPTKKPVEASTTAPMTASATSTAPIQEVSATAGAKRSDADGLGDEMKTVAI